MKNVLSSVVTVGAVAFGLLIQTGCDWSTSGSSSAFNTSKGAGVNANFSGFYRGEHSGGKAVDRTSNGNILTFTITQVGNRLDVIDNQGSRYVGRVGSPGVVVAPDADGRFPAGAQIVESQVTFSGTDGVAAREIEFVGIISIVSVTDIQGRTTESSSGTQSERSTVSSSGQSSELGSTRTRTFTQGDNEITVTTITIGTPNEEGFFQVSETTVIRDRNTGSEVSRTSRTFNDKLSTSSTGSASSSITTSVSEFSISEANTQYRLQGTWVEKGGVVGSVRARSAGGAGSIVVEAPQAAAPTPTAQVTFFN
ncbi:MAG TPA: hypothetical protein PKE55_02560 [Kiritimatiellia bacterium]|nr:hypothetical protein [Kiritimatiellia bacterium]